MDKFVHFQYPKSVDKSLKDLRTKDPKYWEDLAVNKIIDLCNFKVDSVPAYRKFLKDSGAKPKKINSIEDFRGLPLVDKDDYLRK